MFIRVFLFWLDRGFLISLILSHTLFSLRCVRGLRLVLTFNVLGSLRCSLARGLLVSVLLPSFVVASPCACRSGSSWCLLICSHIRCCESVCSPFVWFEVCVVGAHIRCCESMSSPFMWFEVHGVGASGFRGTLFEVTLGVFMLGDHCHHGFPSGSHHCNTLVCLA